MSANPNRANAGWNRRTLEVSPAGPEQVQEPADDNGNNALQALFAFACVQEQAAKRRALKNFEPAAGTPPLPSLQAEFGLDEILQLVAARALSITGADGVAIALAEENAIICRAVAGRIAPDRGIKLDPDTGFSGACLRTGQTIRCDDSAADSRVDPQACR